VPDANDRPHLETAASLAIRNVPMLDGALSAGEVRAGLRKKGYESVEAILILDAVGRYDNTASLKDVLAAHDDARLSSLCLKDWPVVVGLGLSTFATLLMAGFEHALQANVVIAFFIPALVYLADAVGTQTEAVVVRGLSLEMRPLGPLLLGELGTGILIGLPLAVLAFLGIWVWFQDLNLASGVGIALFAASSIVSVLGLILPWFLARAGVDPAFGSGPVATIVQDVLTIAIYFVVMTTVISL
jgi:Mg/Co/Ni transporter MgtE